MKPPRSLSNFWGSVQTRGDSPLRSRCTDDALAFDPAVLLKIVLLAYCYGLLTSSSIAAFVSELGDEAAKMEAAVKPKIS
ncbi:transposase [Methyloversatilis sp. XJ19-49]|uniref:transposase n=1 Tax=Methyloversatilis sp. XJ19-49 TaxID=2963429 RepID=UPI00211C9726|nr:transposase [Methyloversatilis sp. XJ19-49]MCQ9377773.1 transposase [Methyloversatilis sp. XJ19-49]